MAAAGGPPTGSRYVDQRHYVVPADLADLRGPASGTVELCFERGWPTSSGS
jgi:hypothetical protein